MLHFTSSEGVSHPFVWGVRVLDPEGDFEASIQQADQKIARPTSGQRLGGIGFYRTETGQPVFIEADGAYSFDTYLTTYTFANGQYSFALEVHLTLNEGLGLHDAATVSAAYALTLTDGLGLHETPTYLRSVALTLTEGLGLHDAITLNGVYGLTLSESFLMQDTAQTVGGPSNLVTYVINANTGAASEYTNYDFNSGAKLGNKYYAASSAGLFELSGTDDGGTAIASTVRLATTTLSTDLVPSQILKRLPTVYLGVNTLGDIMLKVTANGASNYYTLTGTTGGALHTGRLLLGKGVSARYWDFEITNVSGADFTLESIEFQPTALTRRIVRS